MTESGGYVSTRDVLARGDPWLESAPFAAGAMADKISLGAFVLLLFGAWCAARALGDRARVSFLVVGGVFVAALVARLFVVVFLVLGIALVVRAAIRRCAGWKISAALALGASGCLLGARSLPAPAVFAVGAADPPAETIAALERGNLFQARLWGERWVAEHPEKPGDAALVLAEIDWDLGHSVEARAIAADVAARGLDDDTRRRARDRLLAWKESK